MDIISQDQKNLRDAMQEIQRSRERPIVQFTERTLPEPYRETPLSVKDVINRLKVQQSADEVMVKALDITVPNNPFSEILQNPEGKFLQEERRKQHQLTYESPTVGPSKRLNNITT